MTDLRQVAVEEEMLLLDPTTRRLVGSSDRAVEAAPDGDVEQELFTAQVEIQSAPHRDLAALAADLRATRTTAAAAARDSGTLLAAMPTPVLPDHDGEVTPTHRYERMMARFGLVGRRALACGTHVHVDVADDAEAVTVIDAMRPWLPLLLAVSSNSPFCLGEDTSYASWRAEIWEAWPSAGPTETFGDVAGYDSAVDAVVAAGAALDRAMIYFDARLAREFSTVEIRVADACTDLDDTLLVAAVARALVDACATAPPAPPWRVDLLRAARWRARRHGLSDTLVDPRSGRLVPAADALAGLLDHLGPALERSGDRQVVTDGFDRLLRDGTGADRQRAAAGEHQDLAAVVDDVVRRTVAPPT